MFTITPELVQDHQHALLDEARRAHLGDQLAHVARLKVRARQAARRSRRADRAPRLTSSQLASPPPPASQVAHRPRRPTPAGSVRSGLAAGG